MALIFTVVLTGIFCVQVGLFEARIQAYHQQSEFYLAKSMANLVLINRVKKGQTTHFNMGQVYRDYDELDVTLNNGHVYQLKIPNDFMH
ncbi:hypothetical protein SAMN05216431_11611 [Ligilactobacillus sp. WC1T17]|uniref:Competence protein ComGF n=1 Tax=Ligilactobacillus ruminis TaxID=1623 RepID=A0ABY1AE35_9LACO|nr:hypothetical protein SAMN05216431_11611 [Ligilactobacillus ruminis]